ncbi:MAG: hypothetical protein A2921_00425 [Candidatus Magasanikbacteria bacterium RIFCSPLOWO2_01_FULL_43_20b]|uniref:Uncharacterized protein n=1 Tax=Candidatus Magasanikbacteria bacterium RIFCSPLOWO2_12_FULL_43_12 TaxID=1798692 RepID=A0A1F6MVJ8_9BACT|nr:MAG: hypothetical protein A3I93_02680 [Candidatus Magasanikbacteria bacterium RIFCSPLOWO2_02_FULL_43_22]OGH72094.1 MAG: hypothetical protein A3C74_03945 [Candidatus Magasanikbacteria bacterium RIFCSPHIGHO2_02_FULL_44_13]OGH72879.1 MAG: hypothetical protein A2921_00425 [Candidatus Magasanikbacteria bacterium RIFCSPLOWO2_01_FULL_43_20b]OGH75689.1 MAG: hypothetical protein A3G00_04325 [Candidatus Magasanikbacteria bacterium RIFCSPLOWO2_12_FULL_43_12]
MKKLTQEELVAKIKKLKAEGQVDLSLEEDLSIAVMNLISLEEHFFFTAQKTGKNEYLDLLNQVRQMRKGLLGKMIGKHEGETWCICKHLLAATMRLMEAGTKLLGDGKNSEAQDMFKKAYEIYLLFWGLRLKLIDLPDLKKTGADEAMTQDEVLSRLLDCCKE